MRRSRPTSADVARTAGVSRTAVSFVLNCKPGARISAATRKSVLDAATALGNHRGERGRHLAAGSTSTIGLVLRQARRRGHLRRRQSHRAISDLLGRGRRMSAVFAASDTVAFGAIAGLREHGIGMPSQVSIAGCDDVALAIRFDPPLTTVRVPANDLGITVARAIVDRLQRRSVIARTLVPTEFIERASTAPAAATAGSTA